MLVTSIVKNSAVPHTTPTERYEIRKVLPALRGDRAPRSRARVVAAYSGCLARCLGDAFIENNGIALPNHLLISFCDITLRSRLQAEPR
jgi:hypothetical protein